MVLRNYSGNSGSPTESSLISMVEEYCTAANGGRGITPDDLLQWIESPDGCRIWFDLAVEISRSFQSDTKTFSTRPTLTKKREMRDAPRNPGVGQQNTRRKRSRRDMDCH
jgi:hypothetical protein